MAVPLVSIITPTFERQQFLPLITKCILNQRLSDFEWLVLDDSKNPSLFMLSVSDPRIIYKHVHEKSTIGGKRNYLISQARADVIAQFDDDDFYGESYLSTMMSAMQQDAADIIKLFGFFVYCKPWKIFGYWDLMQKIGPHWEYSAEEPRGVFLTPQNNQAFCDIHLGYGFSYMFKKRVWENNQFPELDYNEDKAFILKALKYYKLSGVHDRHCTNIHILHEFNTSHCFPQYMIPHFLTRRLFPDAADHLAL